MTPDLYKRLVDLYAAHELPLELEESMEMTAMADADLRDDMRSLRRTVDSLRDVRADYTEESHQRILMKLLARGAEITTDEPSSAHFQYALPIQG